MINYILICIRNDINYYVKWKFDWIPWCVTVYLCCDINIFLTHSSTSHCNVHNFHWYSINLIAFLSLKTLLYVFVFLFTYVYFLFLLSNSRLSCALHFSLTYFWLEHFWCVAIIMMWYHGYHRAITQTTEITLINWFPLHVLSIKQTRLKEQQET